MKNESPEQWAVIINPKSGKRKFKRQCDYLFSTLKDANINFEYRLTEFTGHAISITQEFIEKNYRNFLVVGGDGTFSEVVNGIFLSNKEDVSGFKLAIVPRGTGNDWGRFWGLTRNYEHSIEVFLKGNSQSIDIGKIEQAKEESHYFVNTIGLGLDAKIVDLTHRLKRYFGSHSFLYTLSLFIAAFSYRPYRLTISAEGIQIEEKIFTVSIANGCYTGGGLKQTPNALPYDGLFDVMIARKPSFWDIITALSSLFKGKLLEHPIITSFQSPKIEIKGNEKVLLEADGIIIKNDAALRVSIIHKAVQMIVP